MKSEAGGLPQHSISSALLPALVPGVKGGSCVVVRSRLGVCVGALLSCTAARAVAETFLELPGSVRADGDTPASHEIERDFAFAGLAL